jgi:ethanolamine utilization protein EutP (predicted NTPase)
MNDKIRELAREAGIVMDFSDTLYNELSQNTKQKQLKITEKFAELIVKECIGVITKHDYHGEWLGEKIKEHFGVEQ